MADVVYKETFVCVDKMGKARELRIWELQTYWVTSAVKRF
jgi:hypothetical protein